VLVVYCTLAQVNLGVFAAVDVYIRRFFLYWEVPGLGWRVPIFPAGGAVGLLLLANLVAAQVKRFELSWQKVGLWTTHAGLILLFLGEFVTGLFAVETQLAFEEGQTVNYTQSLRLSELAVVETTDPDRDRVVSVPEKTLRRRKVLQSPALPFEIRVRRYYPNSELSRRMEGEASDCPADNGVGTGAAVRTLPVTNKDDEMNTVSACVELAADGKSLGTWLLSAALGAPQTVTVNGRAFALSVRPARHYLPYSLSLKDFRHDRYPGTEIPRNFSSLVHLQDEERGEDRDVLVYMNHPLRYRGRAFYQASFGKNDTLSVLQVVTNPGWTLPYVSCLLVALGMLLHFLLRLRASWGERRA
jgi:cytochrome c biogenesis protein ResB